MTGSLLQIPLDRIDAGSDRARDLDHGHARALADSIEMQGLLYPVLVRDIGNDTFVLVDGLHRFEGFRLLGRAEIPAVLSDKATDDEAMLDQVMANLARRMVALDFCRHLFMLKEAWMRLHPGASAGGDRRSAGFKSQSLAFDPETREPVGFDGAMAEKFGLGRSTVKEAVAIWAGLSNATRQTLHGTALAAKKTELKALSELSPVRQAKVLDLILDPDSEASNVAGALEALAGGVSEVSTEKRFKAVREAFGKLPDAALDMVVSAEADRVIASLKRLGHI